MSVFTVSLLGISRLASPFTTYFQITVAGPFVILADRLRGALRGKKRSSRHAFSLFHYMLHKDELMSPERNPAMLGTHVRDYYVRQTYETHFSDLTH